MPGFRLEDIELPDIHRRETRFKWWREWCFVRTAFAHLKWRLFILGSVLIIGGLLFQHFEPEKKHSLFRATYYTWSLIFGEPPEAFPESTVLRILFFLVPVLGLTVIIEGLVDFAFLMRDRKRYERSWCLTMTSLMKNHIVLVGFGRLGYRAFRLLRRIGEQVVVIEKSEKNRFLEELRRDGSPLIIGDAREDAVLAEANIENAKSVILATNDDLANLESALDVRKIRPDIRVVLRMFDQNMADKIREGFDIHLAMSQSAMAAPAFSMAAIDASIINSFVVDNKLIIMHRWEIGNNGPLDGMTVGELIEKYKCGVAEHIPQEGEVRLFPPPDTKLTAGDEIIIQGPYESLRDLKDRRESALGIS